MRANAAATGPDGGDPRHVAPQYTVVGARLWSGPSTCAPALRLHRLMHSSAASRLFGRCAVTYWPAHGRRRAGTVACPRCASGPLRSADGPLDVRELFLCFSARRRAIPCLMTIPPCGGRSGASRLDEYRARVKKRVFSRRRSWRCRIGSPDAAAHRPAHGGLEHQQERIAALHAPASAPARYAVPPRPEARQSLAHARTARHLRLCTA